MLALLLATAVTLFIVAAQAQVEQLHAAADHNQAGVLAAQVRRLAEGVAAYRAESGGYPGSVATLAASVGQTHLRSIDTDTVRYATATGLSDGTWRFERATVYALDPRKEPNAGAFLTANEHGGGAFDVATDWSGGRDAHWWRGESRTTAPGMLAEQRRALSSLLDRFADYHATHGTFPPGVAPGGSATLSTLVGYGGGATNCTGIHTWDGVPLGCDDLHGRWGHPITLLSRDEDSFRALYLVARTDLTTALGGPIHVSVRLAVEA